MLKAIKKFFGSGEPAPDAVLQLPADPRGAPGTRVYHEYFVDDEPHPDGWHWTCRVYAANGAMTEESGVHISRPLACNAAITWAAKTKAGLRGES